MARKDYLPGVQVSAVLSFLHNFHLAVTLQVDVRDRQAWTELHQAAKNGLEGHIELLLLYGADPNAINVTGNTPLHVCGTWDQDGAAKVHWQG